ncbi:MAG: PAS domain-containing protein [Desulfuromonas sp.]
MTVFLDNDLHVRRFTLGGDKLFKLIPGDVGRPLPDIFSALFYPKMLEETRAVLRTLVFFGKADRRHQRSLVLGADNALSHQG